MAHYNVVLKSIEVDTDILQLPSDIFDSVNGKGTVIDSGTTLAYLPAIVYDELIQKVLARQPGLKLYLVEQQFRCFLYTGKYDAYLCDILLLKFYISLLYWNKCCSILHCFKLAYNIT
ncbi:hypothetical protein GLYMA_20G218902v4 [Glycine max]|nr:hypothetical protein GLYMA_20G218902v4 [Glycine max]KAH1037345.1 hypothetical protein GYH30_056642 [Glycine max]